MHVLAINGAYRVDGTTDQLVKVMRQALQARNVSCTEVLLREQDLAFCLNCRACMRVPGITPGTCVQSDKMRQIVDAIEHCDALILACPTNMGSATAVYKQFMERLAVYGYWPATAHGPQYRKAALMHKKAVLVSSCAAPGWIGRWVYATRGQLKTTAELLGAQVCGTLFTGFHSKPTPVLLPPTVVRQAQELAKKLL